MLDLDTRTAILELKSKGHAARWIAKSLRVSRKAVKSVLVAGRVEVPTLKRCCALSEDVELIRSLHASCGGRLKRVHEELDAKGIRIGYSTLTSFCRREGIGVKTKVRAGQYSFVPGEEMQHDTSPHRVVIGDTTRLVQCASLVLCYSRAIYAQVYPTFNRFWCKTFLQDAAQYFGGTAQRCMIDNTHVVVLHGTGTNAVMVPEMRQFARRLGTCFVAHEVRDANRSARVERSFWHIESNFYPGRVFRDLDDLNRQMVEWCTKVNNSFKRSIQNAPSALLTVERSGLSPLPAYLPPIYHIHERTVDVEGFVCLHTNRYSVPERLLGKLVQVHEGKSTIRIYDGHQLVCEHQRLEDGARVRKTIAGHHSPKARRTEQPLCSEHEMQLIKQGPPLAEMVSKIRKSTRIQPARAIRKLHQIWLDYPTQPVCCAVSDALRFGVVSMNALEQMVLERISGEFFRIDQEKEHEPR